MIGIGICPGATEYSLASNSGLSAVKTLSSGAPEISLQKLSYIPLLPKPI